MVYGGGSDFWSCGYKYSSPNYKAVVSKSEDGGETWVRHELYSGSQYGYVRTVAVNPSNSNNVFAFGYRNSAYVLFKTTNGGSSWSEIAAAGYAGGTPYHMAVHPTDPNRIAVASSGGLYSTTNGGTSWSKVTSGFTNAKDLYQSEGLDGLVISTTSGIWIWENWSGTPVHWGEDPEVPSVNCAIASEYSGFLYAGTAGGAVWASYWGSGTEDESHSEVPSTQVSVSPNPVTEGFASLHVNLPVSGFTSVTVYDLSGRAVQTVYSEVLSAGSHQLELDTSALAPGVYFTSVQNGDISISARFVVSR
ncbi:MAG: T9SS type A sorting domain-containing protein [Candidatus Sabulitectum sp.]|nr:T9SS type A sorting domain-containing protein [Candidatus Sabulitectum sp.]